MLFCAVLLVVMKIETNSCASLKRGKTLFQFFGIHYLFPSIDNHQSTIINHFWYTNDLPNRTIVKRLVNLPTDSAEPKNI